MASVKQENLSSVVKRPVVDVTWKQFGLQHQIITTILDSESKGDTLMKKKSIIDSMDEIKDIDQEERISVKSAKAKDSG